MIVTFFGHKDTFVDDELSSRVKSLIEKCIQDGAEEFLCGGYGKFDAHCASILKDFHKTYSTFKIVFVTPYIHPAMQKNLEYLKSIGLYDEIVYPELENVPMRFAISKRNEWMVDRADIVIAYVTHDWGGAWTTLEYARRKKKVIINLANQ